MAVKVGGLRAAASAEGVWPTAHAILCGRCMGIACRCSCRGRCCSAACSSSCCCCSGSAGCGCCGRSALGRRGRRPCASKGPRVCLAQPQWASGDVGVPKGQAGRKGGEGHPLPLRANPGGINGRLLLLEALQQGAAQAEQRGRGPGQVPPWLQGCLGLSGSRGERRRCRLRNSCSCSCGGCRRRGMGRWGLLHPLGGERSDPPRVLRGAQPKQQRLHHGVSAPQGVLLTGREAWHGQVRQAALHQVKGAGAVPAQLGPARARRLLCKHLSVRAARALGAVGRRSAQGRAHKRLQRAAAGRRRKGQRPGWLRRQRAHGPLRGQGLGLSVHGGAAGHPCGRRCSGLRQGCAQDQQLGQRASVGGHVPQQLCRARSGAGPGHASEGKDRSVCGSISGGWQRVGEYFCQVKKCR